MKKIKKPSTAIFYGNYKEMIYNATPEQVKEIMTAFCQYAFDDITPTVSSDISLAWGIMKGNIDDDFKQYNERCEKNRENALKRYGKNAADTITYIIDNHEYELTFPVDNKSNVIDDEQFQLLFEEYETEPHKRHYYIKEFVKMGNDDNWNQPFETYSNAVWEIITKKS